MNYKIEFEEMRAIRREWINHYLHIIWSFQNRIGVPVVLSEVKKYVRDNEAANFGAELQAYKDFTS